MTTHRYAPQGTYSPDFETACNRCAVAFHQPVPYPVPVSLVKPTRCAADYGLDPADTAAELESERADASLLLALSVRAFRGNASAVAGRRAWEQGAWHNASTSENVRAGISTRAFTPQDVASAAWLTREGWATDGRDGSADLPESPITLAGQAVRSAMGSLQAAGRPTKDGAAWLKYWTARNDDHATPRGPEGRTCGYVATAKPVHGSPVGQDAAFIESLGERNRDGSFRFPHLLAVWFAGINANGTANWSAVAEALEGKSTSPVRTRVQARAKDEAKVWARGITESDQTTSLSDALQTLAFTFAK